MLCPSLHHRFLPAGFSQAATSTRPGQQPASPDGRSSQVTRNRRVRLPSLQYYGMIQNKHCQLFMAVLYQKGTEMQLGWE